MAVLNQDLQKNLENEFKHLGIIAFSRCCPHCPNNYGSAHDFDERQRGICYIRLYLEGMNYKPQPEYCYVEYNNVDYVNKHWDKEYGILVKWASIIGLCPEEFTVIKPSNEHPFMKIEFHEPLELENWPESSDDSDESEDEYIITNHTISDTDHQIIAPAV